MKVTQGWGFQKTIAAVPSQLQIKTVKAGSSKLPLNQKTLKTESTPKKKVVQKGKLQKTNLKA